MMESIVCPVCYEDFNTESNKPLILDKCGHSLCKKCISNLQETMTCPNCRIKFKKTYPNYALMDVLKSTFNSSSDTINYLDTLQENFESYAELLSSNLEANEIFKNSTRRINEWAEKENELINDYINEKIQKLIKKEEKLLINVREKKRSMIKECDQLKHKYNLAEHSDILGLKNSIKTKIQKWKNNLLSRNVKNEHLIQDDRKYRQIVSEYKANLLKQINCIMLKCR